MGGDAPPPPPEVCCVLLPGAPAAGAVAGGVLGDELLSSRPLRSLAPETELSDTLSDRSEPAMAPKAGLPAALAPRPTARRMPSIICTTSSHLALPKVTVVPRLRGPDTRCRLAAVFSEAAEQRRLVGLVNFQPSEAAGPGRFIRLLNR